MHTKVTKRRLKRGYNDLKEEIRFLLKSKTDKDVKKAFDLELERACKFFIVFYKKTDDLRGSISVTQSSYGTILTEIMLNKVFNSVNK